MSTTERIYALLVAANPVPDPDALSESTSDAYPRLRVVETGSKAMQPQQQDQKPSMEAPRRRRLIPVLITAAVIALIATTAVLMSRDSAVDTGPATEPTTQGQSAGSTAPDCSRRLGNQLEFEVPGMDAVEVSCGIVYKTSELGDQTLNLYLPADTQPSDSLPAVIFFHGQDRASLYTGSNLIWGGTARADVPMIQSYQRDQYAHGLAVAASGIVGITFDYSGFPLQSDEVVPSSEAVGRAAQDGLDLMTYVADHAAELNVDPKRICLWTTSSGSITGAYIGLNGSPAAACVVVFTGVLEWGVAGPYSPTESISADMPPFFIGRGATDFQTSESIDRFASLARDAGGEVTVARHPGGHAFEYAQPDVPETQSIIEAALAFIKANLGVG